jgi:hypothetical protein
VDQQDWERKGEGNNLSAEAFHWERNHNILQIKGNQIVYQTKGYIMMSRSMVNMSKGRTSIVHKSFLETDKDCFDNKQ